MRFLILSNRNYFQENSTDTVRSLLCTMKLKELKGILRHKSARSILKKRCSIEPGYLPGLATESFLRIKQPEMKLTFIR